MFFKKDPDQLALAVLIHVLQKKFDILLDGALETLVLGSDSHFAGRKQSGPMMDKILSNRACDLAYYYTWGSNAFGELANAALPGSGSSVASMTAKQKKAVENSIRQLLRKMNKDS